MSTVAFVSLVNDRVQFDACQASLRESARPFPEWVIVQPNHQGWNAAQGLNHGLEQLDAEWAVCVHQDVRFPEGFLPRLTAALEALPADAALAGVVGCERSGRYRGHIVDPNGHCYWPSLPAPVLTLDEVLIAVRSASGLRFSEAVPGFHCYGADICLEAATRGLRAYAIDAPVTHLSTGTLDGSFDVASRWLLAKWGARHGGLVATPTLLLNDDRVRFWRMLSHLRQRRRDRRVRNRNRCGDAACCELRVPAAV